MSNQPQTTSASYNICAQSSEAPNSGGVGCQVYISSTSSTQILINRGQDRVGNINLILRERNYDMNKLIGNMYYLPNGLPIECVMVSFAYSLRLEKYLDKYMAIVVFPKGSSEDGVYIPFEPVVATKDQQHKLDTPISSKKDANWTKQSATQSTSDGNMYIEVQTF